jgi:hypothetical protein
MHARTPEVYPQAGGDAHVPAVTTRRRVVSNCSHASSRPAHARLPVVLTIEYT